MANFYPINTPLINYFFYKAPFVQNGFSLVDYSIQSGGANYSVGDIIIFTGGTFTTPFCAKVATVSSGVVQSLLITNAGVYSTVPTTLTQAFTDGIGSGLILNDLTFESNFLQPPGPNIPLTGGYLFFYEDENRTVQANTYSDVSDPNNPTVNPNPIQLGTSGDCPLFYLDDRFYYIVITDNTGDQSNPVEVIEHYNPSEVISNTSAFNDNFIVNPQFNYQIVFYQTDQEIGEITKPLTNIAWAWEFIEDEDTLSENLVTFGSISGQGIEGDPQWEVVLSSNDVSSDETLKDFRSIIGVVDFYNDQQLTFSAQMQSLSGSPINVILFLEKYYGNGGSPTQIIQLTSFSVGITRNKYTFSFLVPSNLGFTLGDNNYLALRIQPGIRSICEFAMTNVMCLPGSQLSPIYVDEPDGFSKAQILGSQTEISEAGLDQNYSSYYYNDGDIFPYADTGTMVICPINSSQPFREICDGSSRVIDEYSDNDIPYRRLYDVIGTTYGGAGSLIVTSNENVVKFTSSIGGRVLTDYTAGTTSFTINMVAQGLKFGFNLVNNYNGTLSGTFADMFAPNQSLPLTSYALYFEPSTNPSVINYWGTQPNSHIDSGNLNIVTTAPGSGISFCTFTMTFNSNDPVDYETRGVYDGPGDDYLIRSSFLDFATFGNNLRAPTGPTSVNKQILFSVDGVYEGLPGIVKVPIPSPTPPFVIQTEDAFPQVVNLSGRLTMRENLPSLISQMCDPFIWTVTVGTNPLESQYFLFSSSTINYYGWFKVDGIGTDPAVVGRTGVEIDISSAFTTTQTATAIANAISEASYNLPSQAQLPEIPAPTLSAWFINL